jgi:hypothetical protein
MKSKSVGFRKVISRRMAGVNKLVVDEKGGKDKKKKKSR